MKHLPLAVALLALAVAVAFSGDLNPPAGPVQGTFKTLDDVEPSTPIGPLTTPAGQGALHVIAQPGDYHLTGDIVGQAGLDGIRIDVPRVTIDLNGYTIGGVPGSGSGIVGADIATDIHIRDGTVRDWGADGVRALAPMEASEQWDLTEVTTIGNAGDGYHIRGRRGRLIRCVARENGGVGFRITGATFVECVAHDNGAALGADNGFGFTTNNGSSFTRCHADANEGAGFRVTSDAVFRECYTIFNGGPGILTTSDACIIIGCRSNADQTAGIMTGPNSVVERCTVQRAQGVGISVGENSVVTGCSVDESDASGFEGASGSLFVDCTASDSGTAGFQVTDRCRLESCVSERSLDRGFGFGSFNTFVNCTAAGVTNDAGFQSDGSGNRLRDNDVSDTPTGYRINGSGNILTGNTSVDASFSNFIIGGFNHANVITAPTQPGAIVGAGGTQLSTDPYANYALTLQP